MNLKKALVPILSLMFLISGISFITNSATYISDSQKEIIRDSKRLNDLTIFRKAIEDYKTKNGYYPKLETGTNIKGYVNSAWTTQWTSFCNLIGLNSCPVDPINTIIGCDCSAFSLDGKCENNNINSNIDNPTCYNSKDQKFVCTNGSNIYQYQSLNNGRNYSLMMDFEYRKNNDNSAGADYWGVNNNDNDNMVSIDNNCTGVVLSNAKPNCGDNIVQFGEQCDGKNKIEFCTNKSGELGKMPIQCINCKYEVKNTKLTSDCDNSAFCGDGVVQVDKNEECDGGYEKMCFNSTNLSLGKHDWYNEQLRYCQSNCKWSNTESYKNSLTKDICGGYCGDGKIQGAEDCDYGVEYYFWDGDVRAFKKCSDYNLKESCPTNNCEWSNNLCVKKQSTDATSNEKHCYIRSGSSCKYINNSPVMPTIKNSIFTASSYIRDGNNYTESVSSINESTLAVKKTSRNSVYLEFSLGGIAVGDDNISDIDGDEIMYKLEFVDKANNNVGFYKSNYDIGDKTIKTSSRGTEITGKWMKHSELAKKDATDNKFTNRVFFRIYSTALSENSEEANNNIIHLLDGGYFGDYKFKISIKDSWASGANVDGNRQGMESSKEISFYIGSSCGDHVLQAVNDEGQHEYCETKSGFDKFSNWSVNEPSGNGNCAAMKVGPGWNGKWDDVPCSDTYYGICKKTSEGESCPSDWISVKDSGDSYSCYRLTDTKATYDDANTECIYEHDNSQLVNILNPGENNIIKELIEGTSANTYGKFNYTGTPFFWIGFYNVQKLRTDSQNSVFYDSYGKLLPDINKYSFWVPSKENGDPNVYSSSMYNGGSGKNFSSQYLCSETCNDIGGFCGDGKLENGTQLATDSSFYTIQTNADKSIIKNFHIGNFEQCDPTSQGKPENYKGQTGLGTGFYLQTDGTKIGDNYGCSACSLIGGYCGSGNIDSNNFASGYHNNNSKIDEVAIDYEHCDSKYVLTPKESGNNKGGLSGRGSTPNYICTATSDIISNPDTSVNIYKIANPKTENRMTWFGHFNNDQLTLKQFVAEPFKGQTYSVNPNGACQDSTGGYCGDGKIQMAYIGYQLTQQLDESYSNKDYYKDSYSNTELLYNDKDIYLGNSLEKTRKIIVGTSDYRNSSANKSVITTDNKGDMSNVLGRNYNYGINNNNTYISDIGKTNKFDNLSGNSDKYWLEKCDPAYFPEPYETNNLASGSYFQRVDSDLNYIADVNFNGYPTLRYECQNSGDRACDFKNFVINTSDDFGKQDIIIKDTTGSESTSIGYCGDGVITGYGSDGSTQKVDDKTRELCDPKNHIVGPSGSDSSFGDNAVYGCRRNTKYNYFNSDFVFGKDCSSYITPATSNGFDRQYECKYDCTPSGGYCGDGVVQDLFFEECDPGSPLYDNTKYNSANTALKSLGVIKDFSTATMNSNYICGVQNGYDGYSFDAEYQTNEDLKVNFDATSFRDDEKSKNGKVASCKSFGGYCGDGAVQVCNLGNNFYGGDKSYNECLFDNNNPNSANKIGIDSDGDYAFIFNTSAVKIETCDSNDSGCFIVDSGNNAIRPALQSQMIEMYDFVDGGSPAKPFYAELSTYVTKGAGSVLASSYPGTAGKCGTSNPPSVSSTHQIKDLCDVGSA
ncbi:MAG: C-type lectin domain-containing protein, partial [Patescibacteria group bacterium]